MILGILLSASLASAAGVIAAEDSADVKAHITAARKLAGDQWSSTLEVFCATQQQVADMRVLPSTNPAVARRVAEPMKVFDNLYFVGQRPLPLWAITTPDGIILIDSGSKERVEELLAGMKKIGLDPADIRYVIVTHEEDLHFGGSKYLQEHYPSLHVAMSAAAWDVIERGQRSGQLLDAPKRDLALEEGTPLMLGGESVMAVAIPGHTAGSLGFIFPVKDNGKPHVAGLFGGPVQIPAPAVPFDQYQKSIDHWREWTKRMKVDVELQNHPIMDQVFDRMAKLKMRKAGQPNPFVLGRVSYQNIVAATSECAKAQLARRAAN
jgi:metallo-beta-lactamase class B